jgi:hypothetical protein
VVLACVDTIDNDGDGKIDAEDVGCQSPSVPTESDDNEADDQAVIKEVSTLRNAARTNALKQIADAIDAFVKANNNKWECVAGPLPMASKPISCAVQAEAEQSPLVSKRRSQALPSGADDVVCRHQFCPTCE